MIRGWRAARVPKAPAPPPETVSPGTSAPQTPLKPLIQPSRLQNRPITGSRDLPARKILAATVHRASAPRERREEPLMRRLRPKNRRMSPYYGVVSQKISPSAALYGLFARKISPFAPHTVFSPEKSAHAPCIRSFLPENLLVRPSDDLFTRKIGPCAVSTGVSRGKSARSLRIPSCFPKNRPMLPVYGLFSCRIGPFAVHAPFSTSYVPA